MIIYHVLNTPSVHAKLQAQIDSVDSSFPVTYEQAHQFPYLDAVIQEALRIHPPVSGLLERVVPETGFPLPDGRVIAPGTIVGMNQWVITHNREVFGDDVDAFRPERWLRDEGECDSEHSERVKRMNDVVGFVFGGGNRVCIGRNLARVKLAKTTATLFKKYKVRSIVYHIPRGHAGIDYDTDGT